MRAVGGGKCGRGAERLGVEPHTGVMYTLSYDPSENLRKSFGPATSPQGGDTTGKTEQRPEGRWMVVETGVDPVTLRFSGVCSAD